MPSVRLLTEEEAYTLEKQLRTLCLETGEWQVKNEVEGQKPS
jgi:hypothetical protein